MDLRLLESFQAVIENGSLNAAASRLGYAQSTLTNQIQQLEQNLGVQLFQRDGKRLRISEAGVLLKDRSAALLEHASQLERLFEDVVKGNGGRVRIVCVEPFDNDLIQISEQLLAKAPSLQLSIEVLGTQPAYHSLERGLADFVVGPAPRSLTGFTFEPLVFEPVGFLFRRTHPLARRKYLELTDIVGEPLVLSGMECEYRHALEQAAVAAGVQLQSQLTITSLEGRVRAAQHGIGLAIVPVSCMSPLPRDLVLRRPHEQQIGITLGIARRTDAAPPSPTLQQVLEAIRTHSKRRKQAAQRSSAS